MMTPRVTSHLGTGGAVATAAGAGSAAIHLAWLICLASMLITLGFALLRFVPRRQE
jgi:4-hydroxybenzoate polyprenyltransferase